MAKIEVRSTFPLEISENIVLLDKSTKGCVRVPWSKSKRAESSRFTYTHYEITEGAKTAKGWLSESKNTECTLSIRKVSGLDIYETYNPRW